MKRKNQRLISLILLLIFCCAGVAVVGINLQESISFFYYPSELPSSDDTMNKRIRLGGIIVHGSIVKSSSHINFSIADDKKSIPVIYKKKVLPNLFKENNGVIVEGDFIDGQFFANNILAKHNEDYRPNK